MAPPSGSVFLLLIVKNEAEDIELGVGRLPIHVLLLSKECMSTDLRLAHHITDHLRDNSLQASKCTSSDN